MQCRRYVMTMTRQTRRTIGGITVTVSMPHRFPYGSLFLSFFFFFASRRAPSSSILPIDRYCCAVFSTKPAVYFIARGLAGGSRDIESDDNSKCGPRDPSASATRTLPATFARGIPQRCIFPPRGCTAD
ncbi:hypothetical protein PUN28_000785 [Cardiocondyla obscurior]|uniref:Secreted protein n=1 Tax=Cardiocondyla obscurior TaxID=286306 RepID=A0AAW2H1E8_9HYME